MNIIMAINLQFFLSIYMFIMAFCADFANHFRKMDSFIADEMKLKKYVLDAIQFHLKILR